MSKRSITSSARCRHRGVTLIEALAGLVILGTLLAGVTTARSRANEQYAQSQQRLAASRALDALIAQWYASPTSTVPLNAHGALPQAQHLQWRTTTRSDAATTPIHAVIARVEVFDPASRSRLPLLSVDLLVPAPRPATQPTTRPGGAQ